MKYTFTVHQANMAPEILEYTAPNIMIAAIDGERDLREAYPKALLIVCEEEFESGIGA